MSRSPETPVDRALLSMEAAALPQADMGAALGRGEAWVAQRLDWLHGRETPDPVRERLRGVAAWLIDETGLYFTTIAAFCGLTTGEVEALADGVASDLPIPVDPRAVGWLTAEELARAEADPAHELRRPPQERADAEAARRRDAAERASAEARTRAAERPAQAPEAPASTGVLIDALPLSARERALPVEVLRAKRRETAKAARAARETRKREGWRVSPARARVVDPAAVRAGAVERLRPITDAVLTYARRFLAADWPLGEVAWLFDVHPEELASALPEALRG